MPVTYRPDTNSQTRRTDRNVAAGMGGGAAVGVAPAKPAPIPFPTRATTATGGATTGGADPRLIAGGGKPGVQTPSPGTPTTGAPTAPSTPAPTIPTPEAPPAVLGAPSPPSTLTTQTTPDPAIKQAVDDYRARIKQQQDREGVVDPNLQTQVDRLGGAISDDTTQRMMDRATGRIRTAAAGRQDSLNTELEKRGVGGGGYEGRRVGGISDAAARASAKAAADIEMGERGRKDALILGGQRIMEAPGQERLAREAGVDRLVGGSLPFATAPAELALKQGAQGLQQWEALNRNSLERAGLQTRQWESANRFGLDRERMNLDAQLGTRRSELDDRNQMIREWEAMMRQAGY